jgi:hypothetical protein
VTELPQLTLRFYERGRPEVNTVAAAALAQSLDALQRLVHLTAMRREGRTPGRRIRPSADLQARYRLFCDTPLPGSFISPVHLGSGDLASESLTVMSEVGGLLAAVGREDEPAIVNMLPDPVWRRFSMDAIERMAPPSTTETELEVLREGIRIIDTGSARAFVEKLARATSLSKVREAVVGQFKRIDFVTRQITIRHTQTERDLTCTYELLVEENLLAHPRDTLLVFGTVTRDAAGYPISIAEVDHIEAIDSDPYPIPALFIENQRLEPIQGLHAEVGFDEGETLYTAAIPSLSVNTFAETRDGLIDALHSELSLLWRRYALAQDEMLTPAAQALKRKMLETFRRDTDAPKAPRN